MMMKTTMGGDSENEDHGSSSAMNNNGGGEGVSALKKGPWTAAEDAVLADYVRSHGEGNWNAVQKNTGLARCGKSCRLRWANHLRPNLKKGSFSPHEERIIVELHAKMGNKWARMATQLPGRTDNEIKNYWNTRVKRKQRQGLPLYPPELKPLYLSPPTTAVSSFTTTPATPLLSPASSAFSFQTLTSPPPQSLQLTRSASHLLHNPYTAAPTPPCLHSPGAASTTSPLPSPSTSTQNYGSPFPSPQTNPSFTATAANHSSVSDGFFFPRASPYLQPPPLRFKRFRGGDGENNNSIAVNGGGGGSSASGFGLTMNGGVFEHSLSLDPNTLDFPSPGTYRTHFDSGQFLSIPGFVHQSITELPSNQILSQYGTSDFTFDANTENDHHNHHSHEQQRENLCVPIIGETGLLEDMLEDAQIFAGGDDDLSRRNCLDGFASSNEGG